MSPLQKVVRPIPDKPNFFLMACIFMRIIIDYCPNMQIHSLSFLKMPQHTTLPDMVRDQVQFTLMMWLAGAQRID